MASKYEDVDVYADNKGDFVQDTLEKARVWREGRQVPPSQPVTGTHAAHGDGDTAKQVGPAVSVSP